MKEFRLALLVSFVIIFIAGCGSSSGGSEFSYNLSPSGPPIVEPGETPTGSVILRTQLEPNAQALNQLLYQETFTHYGQTVPTEVTEFSVTGVDSQNAPVFGPQVFPKANEVVIEGVPTTAMRLRIELLDADGFVLGATSVPLVLGSGQSAVIDNPTYGFIALGGEPGPQGPKGEKGDKGDMGPPGADGIPGGQGPAGIDGADGEAGPQGPAGEQGVPGATGPQGPAGDKGDRGDMGPPGAHGDPGPAGADGKDGKDGLEGAIGPEGPAGPQGPPGDSIEAYGSFQRTTTGTGDVVDFDFSESSVRVVRNGFGTYTVGEDGDYLVSISLLVNSSSDYSLGIVNSSKGSYPRTAFGFSHPSGEHLYAVQHIVSVQAEDQLSLQRLFGSGMTFGHGKLSIIRIGSGD